VPVEIRLHPRAEQELRAAYLWYAERNEIVAEAMQLEIDHAMKVVSESPNRWPRLTKSERRYVLPRFPFSLVYRVNRQFIEIIAVAHQKRRPGYWSVR
jgi:plasmid stabilization system protein ParE